MAGVGWIFPNYIEGKGYSKVETNFLYDTYIFRKYISAGVILPGFFNIPLYGANISDNIRVFYNVNAGNW